MFLRLDRRSTLARRRRDQGEVVEAISNIQYPIPNTQYPNLNHRPDRLRERRDEGAREQESD